MKNILQFLGWLFAERNDYRGVHVATPCSTLKWQTYEKQ